MLKPHFGFQGIEHGLDDEAFAQHGCWCTNQLLGVGSAAIAVCQAMRCDTGMPSRVIRLSTEQATRASVFWLGRVRARRPRPMMVLYRNTAVSPSERLP